MIRWGVLPVTAILAVCAYYFFAWLIVKRSPKQGPVIPQYNPPSVLSPAMVRYVWKEHYDDRVFWASVLSLVAKNFAQLDVKGSEVSLCAEGDPRHSPALPPEEQVLLKRLQSGHKGKPVSMNLVDDETAYVAGRMAESLRRQAVGTWFNENKLFLWIGIALSALAVLATAQPRELDEWIAFSVAWGVIAPGAYYLAFLLLRLRDVCRSARERVEGPLLRRGGMLFLLATPCVAALALGCVTLGNAFGWATVTVAVFLAALTVLEAQLLRAPTAQGRALLEQIAGFRLFLEEVERSPMDRNEAPGEHAGVYEKYLAYAVALELDQQWSDSFIALASTSHKNEKLVAAHSFYLGMWNGKPVEMVYGPQSVGPPSSRAR